MHYRASHKNLNLKKNRSCKAQPVMVVVIIFLVWQVWLLPLASKN